MDKQRVARELVKIAKSLVADRGMVAFTEYDADELKLFIMNDDGIGRFQESILKNLKGKMRKGTYDSKLAVKAFLNLMNVAAERYVKEYEIGRRWHQVFPMSVRLDAAKILRDDFEEEAGLGNFMK